MRPRARLAFLAAALAFAGALPACASSKADTTGLATRGFYASSYDTLWEVGTRELTHAGFAADDQESSKKDRVLVSRWNYAPHPFSGKGYRERATLKFVPVKDQPDQWTVEANVLREPNKNFEDPSNLLRAEWGSGVRVPDVETRIAGEIEMFFLPREVSPQFRTRYGMPAVVPPEGPEASPKKTR